MDPRVQAIRFRPREEGGAPKATVGQERIFFELVLTLHSS
jgi:hypothetical protein